MTQLTSSIEENCYDLDRLGRDPSYANPPLKYNSSFQQYFSICIDHFKLVAAYYMLI